MENPNTAVEKKEKGKRLTKKQAGILFLLAVVVTIIMRQFNSDSILVSGVGAAGELTATFDLL